MRHFRQNRRVPAPATPAGAQEQRQALGRAARLLAAAADFHDTLRQTLGACLPTVADFGFFDVVVAPGDVRRTVAAHDAPDIEAILEPTRWVEQHHPELNLCALSTGEAALHADTDDAWYRRIAASEAHLDVLRTLGFRSMITVPVRYRDELVGALTWFKVSRENRDRYLVSYDRLNRTIETALKANAPYAIWWPSSPASGYLDYGDAWHADGSGDMHYWSVWHENRSFDNYRSVKPRFCSEFGFQSYTSMPVIGSFAREADLNIASPVMEAHQKNRGGNERIAATMFRYFRFPADFAKFVYVSQIQQALAIQTAVDYWRSLKPHCMGTLYWQLNDTWPVASWASLDYGGGWKALHHAARRFFQPVHVAVIPEPDGFRFTAVNDTVETVELVVRVHALTLAGQRIPLDTLSGSCPTDRAADLGTIARSQFPADAVLAWSFTASNGMHGAGHQVQDTYKALDLQPSGLAHTAWLDGDETVVIDVSAQGLALHVMIETDCPGRFSDNLFDLSAGEQRRILFRPEQPVTADTLPLFTLLDLHSSQTVTGQELPAR